MRLLCRFGFHCYHEDYNKPYTWEDVDKAKKHGAKKPIDISERVNPPPPPPRSIPAGFLNVCCHCGKYLEKNIQQIVGYK